MVRTGLPRTVLFAVIASWIAIGLVLDHDASLWRQRGIGALTWMLLVGLLARERRAIQLQVVVLIAIATAMEYAASPLLGLYTYRLGNVPAYVPPGHGLVYLAALAVGGSLRASLLPRATLAIGGIWAIWGVTLSDRLDTAGLAQFACYAAFVLLGRAPALFAVVFLLTSELELIGTHLANWTWATHDPTGLFALGNPPSGIAGGYGFLDAAALGLAALVLRRTRAVPS